MTINNFRLKKARNMKLISLMLIMALMMISVLTPVPVQAETVSGIESPYSAGDSISIDYEVDETKGILDICVTGTGNDISVKLAKDDKSYFYRLKSGEKAAIPLNMETGEYTLAVLLYTGKAEGVVIWRTTLAIELDYEHAPYLSPSQIVNWTEEMALTEMAKKLSVKNDPMETALEICRFIAKQYSYDKSITTLPCGYIPDLVQIYAGKKGICYDYASLYAAMCRSVGIPAKLIFGYSSYAGMDRYHAWCLVQVGGMWKMVDPIYSMKNGAKFLDSSKTVEVKQY